MAYLLRVSFLNGTNGGCNNGTVRIGGPKNTRYTASSDQTWKNVDKGRYTASFLIQPSSPSGLITCSGSISPTSLDLNGGDLGTFEVTITASDGALRVILDGYPESTLGAGHITVQGPGGQTLSNPPLSGGALNYGHLPPGTYTVTATSFTHSSGIQYAPQPTSLSVNVDKGRVTEATVRYTGTPPSNTLGLNVTVECPTCTPTQLQNTQPMVCLYLGTGAPSSIPRLPLLDCPQATPR